MNCQTCHQPVKKKGRKYCSRKCLYVSPDWRVLVRNRTKEQVVRHGTLEDRTCVGCRTSFQPWNYKQRNCGKCFEGLSKKQRARILRYGITVEELKALESREHCDLCEKIPQHVDHDHKTNKVRGFLCPGCNQAMNRIEIPGWIEKAVNYLKG